MWPNAISQNAGCYKRSLTDLTGVLTLIQNQLLLTWFLLVSYVSHYLTFDPALIHTHRPIKLLLVC